MIFRTTFMAAVAGMLVLPVGSRGYTVPDVSSWTDAVHAQRRELDGVIPSMREQEAKKRLYELRLSFPVLTDWVLQDGAPDGFRLLMPGDGALMEHDLLRRLGGRQDLEDSPSRLRHYAELCMERRKKRLASVLDTWAPFAFTEMYSVYATFIGYTEGLSDARFERYFRPGSRLTVLAFDDASTFGKAEHLLEDEHGMMRDVDVSYDRGRLLFAWKKSSRLDDYHIHEFDLNEKSLRQLTFGIGRADYEPVYLPGGDIIFASTRPEQSVPCWWNEISNLYRMGPDGGFVRRLAIDQVQTLYPQVHNDGRITYTRWDYSDRGQVYPHPVFSMDPDGQAQRVYYGGNSWFPNSLLHTRPIPGSSKAMAVASGHHTQQRGKLVMLDVSRGRDEGEGMQFIAPKRDVPYERVDAAQQHGDQFRYPYPFSETELMVSYVPDWGFSPEIHRAKSEHAGNNIIDLRNYADSSDYGLYWMNVDGERELLYRDDTLGVQRPVALGYKPAHPVIPETVDFTKDTGTLYVHDVYKGVGLEGIPRGEAKKVRVVRLNYRAAGVGLTQNHGEGGTSMNSTPVSIGNGTWDVKEILGDAEIHADGSALFEVPADESIYLQVLNDRGEVIQTTRTWDTVRPGEQKACVGCHDKGNANFYPFEKEDTLAWEHGIQKLQPFYGETRGFSFQHEIQPILDRSCVSCHDGTTETVMDLRPLPITEIGQNKRTWTRSYLNLTGAEMDGHTSYTAHDPEGGLVSWISKMSRPTEIPPYFAGAAKSRLLDLLDEGHYDVTLTEEEYHKFAAWMDLLVPFSGSYREGHAWGDHEVRAYGYYEEKRKQQHKEELRAIAAYLGRMDDVEENEPVAAFTRARYDTVWEARDVSLSPEQKLAINAENAFLFDRIVLHTESSRPAHVRLLHDAKTIHAVTLDAGPQTLEWHSGGPAYRSGSISIQSDHALTIRVVEARGVRENELPSFEGFRRHLNFITK